MDKMTFNTWEGILCACVFIQRRKQIMGSSNKIDISRFDPTNASDDQIRLWLFAIIEAELEKDDAEIDQELIAECSDCEALLSHSNPEISQEEYVLGLARIKEKAQATQAKGANVTVQAKPKKRRFMRVAGYFLAAALAVSILTVGVVAAFNGSAAWEFIVENIGWIWTADPGDTLANGKVTLIKGEIVTDYDSVEEALISEGIKGVLLPTALPDSSKITRIIISHCGNETQYAISFITDSSNTSFEIYNYEFVGLKNWETLETKEVDGLTFYIVYIEALNKYQAGCYHNGYEHVLSCTNYDDLISIIYNIKEMD